MTGRTAAAAARVASWARQASLPARRRERAARAAAGMPARHPEHLTRDLRRRQQRWLAAVSAQLWPADEYTAIITDTRRENP